MDERENKAEKTPAATVSSTIQYPQYTTSMERESTLKFNSSVDSASLSLPTADLDSINRSMAHSRLEGVTNTSLLQSAQPPQVESSVADLTRERSIHGILNTTVEETEEP